MVQRSSQSKSAACGKTHNILILENEFVMGGLEKKLYDFVSRAKTDHYRFSVCCLKDGGYFKTPFKKLGVHFVDRAMSNKFDLLALGRLKRVIADREIDLLYTVPHPNTLIFAHLLKKFTPLRRVVVSIHATGGPEGGRLIPRYLAPFLQSVDRFIAVANRHRDYLVEGEGINRSKIVVIHNGVDLSTYSPGPPPNGLGETLKVPAGRLVIINVASLKPLKRIDLLLRAVARIIDRRGDVHLLLVGDGAERSALTDLAETLGITSHVSFAGIRDDVDQILRGADVFALTSRTEAFPNVILEAMATGLPVVTTDVGSVREMVEDGKSGLIVPSQNVDALERALNQLLDASDKRSAFGGRGREIVETRFDLEDMCKKREELFSELLC